MQLVDNTQLDSDLTSVADAIRERGATGQLVFPSGFVTAIGEIGEPEHISEFYRESYTLADTLWNGWTPSTTAKAIIASKNLPVIAINTAEYEYWIRWRFDYENALNEGATQKVQVDRQFGSLFQNIHRRPYGVNNFETMTDSYNYCTSAFVSSTYTIYWNSSGSHTWTSGISYGIYGALTAATFSSTTATAVNMTPKTPVINARCSNTYMSTARAAEVDQDNSTTVVTGDLYRVKQGESNTRKFYRDALEMYSNPLEVTS